MTLTLSEKYIVKGSFVDGPFDIFLESAKNDSQVNHTTMLMMLAIIFAIAKIFKILRM